MIELPEGVHNVCTFVFRTYLGNAFLDGINSRFSGYLRQQKSRSSLVLIFLPGIVLSKQVYIYLETNIVSQLKAERSLVGCIVVGE